MAAESPIFVKSYELTRWLLAHTQKFPKSQRFVLAQRLEQAALDLIDALTAAGRTHKSERLLRNLALADQIQVRSPVPGKK